MTKVKCMIDHPKYRVSDSESTLTSARKPYDYDFRDGSSHLHIYVIKHTSKFMILVFIIWIFAFSTLGLLLRLLKILFSDVYVTLRRCQILLYLKSRICYREQPDITCGNKKKKLISLSLSYIGLQQF